MNGNVVARTPVHTEPCTFCRGSGYVTYEHMWTVSDVACDDCGGSGDEWVETN